MKLDIDRTAVSQHAGAPLPFARVCAITPFIEFLTNIGAPTDRLLRQARIPAGLLDDPEGLVPLFSSYRFIESVARQENLKDLGMIVGQRASAFDLGAYGASLQGASNVYQYLQIGTRLIGKHSSGTQFWLSEEGDVFRINQYLKGPAGLGRCIADVYTLTLAINMLRRFMGATWSPGEVRLMMGDETLIGNREVLGYASLLTGQRHSSFTIARSLMKLPAQDARTGSATTRGAKSGDGHSMPADFVCSIQQLLASLRTDGYPSMHEAAEAAGISPRTLQRRLAHAGVTYSDLVVASRMRLARNWLDVTDMRVTDIAAKLGYTDVSNFARAFRRETGISPSAYRLNQPRG